MFGYVIKISNQFVPCDTVLHTGAGVKSLPAERPSAFEDGFCSMKVNLNENQP